MLDGLLRPIADPFLNNLAQRLKNTNLNANTVTWTGFCLGMAGCFAAGVTAYTLAMVFIILSRFMDTMDGALARAKGTASEYGGYLDIVLDMVVYAAFPALFVMGQPHHAGAGVFLLFFYMAASTTFLSFGSC